MIENGSIKVGSLVVDANPYKAPELFYGFGVVIDMIDENYAIVYWSKYDVFQTVRMSDLGLIDENG